MTAETKVILGISATVVHDIVTQDGQVIEDTFDWYAQDRSGNLWYLGEATEDAAAVLSLDERAEVPYGRFEHVLLTKDYTPLDPTILEYKFYAPGSDRSSSSAYQADPAGRNS